MKTSHPIGKNTFIHSYTYTFFHGQRLSFVKVGEDQSNGCQSLTLENTNRSSGVHSYLLRSQQCEDVCSQMCVCVTHQSHVICQYSPTNSLWYFFGRETSEAVIVQLASLLPEGWQQRFVFSSTHPGQRLPLVKHERSTHSLQRKGLRVNVKAAL